MNTAKTKIDLTLSLGKVNDMPMSLEIFANDREVYSDLCPDQNRVSLQFECDLPAKIVFKVAGKQEMDTVLDHIGNIVQDKYVKVDQLIVDRMPVERWILESRIFEFTDELGNINKTNYFGKNGQACLHIDCQDSFDYFLQLLTKT